MKSVKQTVVMLFVGLLTLGVFQWKDTDRAVVHAMPAAKGVPTGKPAAGPKIVSNYGQLPMSFEANQGQTDERAKFLSRGLGYNLFLMPDEAVLTLFKPQTKVMDQATGDVPHLRSVRQSVVRMRLVGANTAAKSDGLDEISAKSNYFIGSDSRKWQTGIANYGRVQFSGVYPGVDLVFHGNQRQFEYDFDLAPGASPEAIHLKFEGAKKIAVNATGDLELLTVAGDLVFKKPMIYQASSAVADGHEPAKTSVDGEYRIDGKGQVSFQVGAYDRSRELIIDPVLVYSNFLGGSLADSGNAIAVDFSGNAYVTGSTNSLNFPTPGCVFGCVHIGATDAFVTEFNAAGIPVFSDYLGGNLPDAGYGIAVDGFGYIYVTGATASPGFPLIACTQCAYGGGASDAFMTIVNPGGAGLFSSTFLGGAGADYGLAIAVNANRGPYVTGYTSSFNFPVTAGVVQPVYGGGASDAFVTNYVPAGPGYVYSTYLGGALADYGRGIAVDGKLDACITGNTLSVNFPTFAPHQPANHGASDAFVTVLHPGGTSYFYSTYLGGGGNDYGRAIAVDDSLEVYVTGNTLSPAFPVTAGAFQTVKATGSDAFVTKYKTGGAAYVYSTFLGGTTTDSGNGIALDTARDAYIVGTTGGGFPVAGCTFGCAYGGGVSDAFVAELKPTGAALIYSDYLGGAGTDNGLGAAVNTSFGLFATGNTASNNFPVPGCSFCVYGGGPMDAFVSRIQ